MNASAPIKHSELVLRRVRQGGAALRPRLGPTGSNWLQFGSIQLGFLSFCRHSRKRSTKDAKSQLMKIVPVSSLRPQQESEGSTLEPLNKPVWEYNAEQTAALSFI